MLCHRRPSPYTYIKKFKRLQVPGFLEWTSPRLSASPNFMQLSPKYRRDTLLGLGGCIRERGSDGKTGGTLHITEFHGGDHITMLP